LFEDNRERLDLAAVYDHHRLQVYRHLLRRTGSAQDAEELTQVVFTEAVAAVAAGTRPSRMLAWLFAVAERRFVDEVRRRSRTAAFGRKSFAPASQEVEDRPPLAQVVRDGMELLPEDQREVVIMRIFEGRPYTEISTRVGVSEAACKMRFSRGVSLLRRFLQAEGVAP
jgi:RNA polymerase sigma factor (sigma-70 family)